MNAPFLRQRVVGRPDQVLLFLEIPVMQDHPHCNHIRFGQRVTEKISRGGLDAVRQAFSGDCLSRDGFDCRQIEGDAFHMRMSFRHQS
jgi:hypothetical protein